MSEDDFEKSQQSRKEDWRKQTVQDVKQKKFILFMVLGEIGHRLRILFTGR